MAVNTITGPSALAAVGTTGNNTGASVDYFSLVPSGGSEYYVPVVQFLVEAVGGTPTVTFKIQGSLDGTNFANLAYFTSDSDTVIAGGTGSTVTAVGATICNVSPVGTASRPLRKFRYYRIVTSANTNVTYSASLYAAAHTAS